MTVSNDKKKMGCISSKPACVICYGVADQILWPCGHFCLCADCTIQLSNHQSIENLSYIKIKDYTQIKCPLCRSFSIPAKAHI